MSSRREREREIVECYSKEKEVSFLEDDKVRGEGREI